MPTCTPTPWFQSYGGANDRFMMAAPEAADAWLGMYDYLCGGEESHHAAHIPHGVNSERLYKW